MISIGMNGARLNLVREYSERPAIIYNIIPFLFHSENIALFCNNRIEIVPL